MKVERASYTFESFLAYLKDSHEDVFEESDRKKWLKVYGVLHDFEDWRAGLFSAEECADLGEVCEIRLAHETTDPDDGAEEVFYGVEYQPGLVLFFTSAIQDGYAKTLHKRLRTVRGATAAWIPPAVFQQLWQSILEKQKGFVSRFTSRRAPLDDTPAKIRPGYARRFNYTGDDGTQVVKELQREYGVSPESMYIRISPALTVQITNSGFFSARDISPLALQIMVEMFELVATQTLSNRNISRAITFRTENAMGEASLPRVAVIETGAIKLRGNPLSPEVLDQFVLGINEGDEFSVLDSHLKTGSLGFSATVVDELKNAVFDISITEDRIALIPKHFTTFESFLSFYRQVTEQLDEQAILESKATASG